MSLEICAGDYHQVNSDGPNNLAVSILFGRFDNVKIVNFSDCTADPGKFVKKV